MKDSVNKIINAIKNNNRHYYDINSDILINCEVRTDTDWFIDFIQMSLKPTRIAVTKNAFNEDTILTIYSNGEKYNVVWLDDESYDKLLNIISK